MFSIGAKERRSQRKIRERSANSQVLRVLHQRLEKNVEGEMVGCGRTHSVPLLPWKKLAGKGRPRRCGRTEPEGGPRGGAVKEVRNKSRKRKGSPVKEVLS